jgi:hypothetical protein
MDQVRNHFEKHAKRGITLSAAQLAKFARAKQLKGVTQASLRQIRHEFKFTAFASRYRRPLKYMSSSVARYGVVMADMANFMKQHSKVNGGAKAFLCCVECISGQLAVVPVPDLTRKSWKKALNVVFERSAINAIRILVTDRDSALKSSNSKGLRQELQEEHGVGWLFLKSRSKAFKVGGSTTGRRQQQGVNYLHPLPSRSV